MSERATEASHRPGREGTQVREPAAGASHGSGIGSFLFLRPLDDGASGAAVARTFQKGLALLFAIAWLSLAGQVLGLIGSRGLLPFAETLAAIREDHPVRFMELPSFLLWLPGDGWLRAGPWLGVVFALAAGLGLWPRAFFAASTLLYLSYATACRTFLAFQWDNLLLEAGFLAALLPGHEARRGPHFLFRVLLFKLYFESGLAKWQSPAGDWRDGSAMTFYYETAPLPTPLALYAHRLPVAWHHLESWATLILELVVPFFIFGPRRARLAAFGLFTLFQLCDFASANYGFFCPLAAWLGLFLVGERDLARLRGGGGRVLRVLMSLAPRRAGGFVSLMLARLRSAKRRFATLLPRGLTLPPRMGWILLVAVGGIWLLLSAAEGYAAFGEPGPWFARLAPLLEPAAPFRLSNVYHLFASVTRERVEPTFEVEVNGAFRELAFHYKPGPLDRPPPFVAPHQPRVDFQLWFHGLAPQRQPAWVARLLGALCEDRRAMAWLFAGPLPQTVSAVRVSYYLMQFADASHAARVGEPQALDRRFSHSRAPEESGRWWTRRLAFRSPEIRCRAEVNDARPTAKPDDGDEPPTTP